MDKELFEAIAQMMDRKLQPINDRLDKMDERLDILREDVATMKEDMAELKEAHDATRSGVNSLLEWAEECGNVIKFPLPKVK